MRRPISALLLLAGTIVLGLGPMSGCELFEGWATPRGGEPSAPAITRRPPTTPTEEQQQRLDDADAAREAGDYQTALALFREILAENPTITTAHIGIGDVHMDTGDYTQAEPAYGRAARLEPRNYDAQYKHGLALQMLERFVDAVRAYQRALVIRPSSFEAHLNLATTFLQMGEARSALASAERAVELNQEDASARINLGAVYDQLEMYDEAIEEYRTAMELIDDPSAELIMNLINVLSKAERYQETIDAAQTLSRIQPTAAAFERAGWAHFKLKEFERSADAYRRAVELDPQHWPAWNGIGVNAVNRWLLSKKTDSAAKEEAGRALRTSLRLNPDQQNVMQLVSTYRL